MRRRCARDLKMDARALSMGWWACWISGLQEIMYALVFLFDILKGKNSMIYPSILIFRVDMSFINGIYKLLS